MSYQLGIDLGTTYTAAAVCRSSDEGRLDPEVVTLGTRSATVASVLYIGADGQTLVGEAAERRALTEPDRVVREFKRRIGDDTPIIVGGTAFAARELAARMVKWVVERVAEREGGPAARIAVTHPASWGAHRKQLLASALQGAGLSVTFLAEPQAAAVSYAGAERVESGSTIGVYDLGGGTFDAAVVRKNGGFTLLGQPEGIDRLGGIDFDQAVFDHVKDGLNKALETLDPTDPGVLTAVARLRRECVEAKEALSSDTEVTIPVLLPELRTQARLVRSEFEAMIRPQLEETVEALQRAVASAGLTPADLSTVLLVGGSSRIPLVSQLVSETLGRPVAVDADPKNAIALGAALAVSPQPKGRHAAPAPGPPTETIGVPLRGASPAGAPPAGPQPTPPRGIGPRTPPGGQPQAPPRIRPLAAAAGAAGLAAGAGVAGTGAGIAATGGVAATGAGPAGTGASWASAAPPPLPLPPPLQSPEQAHTEWMPPQNSYGGPPPMRPGLSYDRPPAEPQPRRSVGMLVAAGGVLAIAAIIGAIYLWPTPSPAGTSTDSTGDVPTAEVAPPVQEPTTTAARPPVAPPRVTTPPKVTTTTKPPPSSPPTVPPSLPAAP